MLRFMIGTARQGLAASLVGIALGGIAFAQDTASTAPQVNTVPDKSASPSGISLTPAANAVAVPPPISAPASPAQLLTQAQLDQLVAPIALYPDPLLAQILMASTYPLEVVEAARWASATGNRGLTGEVMTNALQAQNWDPSVKALVPFPRVLENMSNQLQWTEELGNAFLAQQADVMAAVQSMRQAAMIAGNLKQTPQCRCVVHVSGSTISILPAEPQMVCVPVYSPVVYGRWPYPAYPPYSFPVPVGFVYPSGFWIGFGPPIALAVFGPVWGWGWVDWGRHYIAVDPGRYVLASGGRPAFSGNVWVHNPAHRGGVAYADPVTSARFNAARVSALTTAARSGAGNAMATTRAGGTGRFGAVGFAAARSTEHFGAASAHGGAAAGFRSDAGFHGSTIRSGAASRAGRSEFHNSAGFHGGVASHGGTAFRGGAIAFHGGAASHGAGPHSGGAPHFVGGGPHGGGGPHFAMGGPHGGGAPHGAGPHGGGPGGQHGGGGGHHG
jgi:Protein of unknown function (DUF3300)